VYLEHRLNHPEPQINQGSHFTIGSEEPSMAKNNYESEFKQQFGEKNSLPLPTVANSNEGNNIILGFGSNPPQTNYQLDFVGG
jgi:hypothetical protein